MKKDICFFFLSITIDFFDFSIIIDTCVIIGFHVNFVQKLCIKPALN